MREGVDWTTVMRIATRHQLASLVGFNLCSHFANDCPVRVIDEFRTCLRDITARNLFLSRELIRVLGLLEACEIPVLPFKGPMLASTAYGHVGLRSFCDLDVLVGGAWEYRVHLPEILRSDGWTLFADNGHECTYVDAGGTLQLDVHDALTEQWMMPFRLKFGEIRRRCSPVPFMGATLEAIAPSDMLILLCVQLAKDTGDEGMSPRLIKVCDIAQVVDAHPKFDWTGAVREARRRGALRILCVGLGAARQLLRTPLPAEIVQLCNTIPRFDSLVTHVEERVVWGRVGDFSRPELLSRRTWHAALRERRADRSAIRSLIRRATVPNSRDYAFVRLPAKWLFPFYVAVKPIRLAAKLWATAIGRVSTRD